MKIELDIPDDKLRSCIETTVRDGGHWYGAIREKVARLSAQRISEIPVDALVKEFIAKKMDEILKDVVYAQLRHVVKLAVDRELAVARVSEEAKKGEGDGQA